MKFDAFISLINDCCNDIAFSFQGKSAGIIPEVENYAKIFHMWYGEKEKDYSNMEDLITDKFFDGQSIKDIYNKISIEVS